MSAPSTNTPPAGSVASPGDDIVLRRGPLHAVVRPAYGGHVASLRWRDHELLAQPPSPRAGVTAASEFAAGGLGGIDDCLPAIAPGVHPHGGSVVPDHGDVWFRPATVLQHSSDALALTIDGHSAPYSLERTVAVEPARLRVSYRLASRSTESLALVWAAHPLLAVSPGARFALGETSNWTLESVCEAWSDARLDAAGTLRGRRGAVALHGSWDALAHRFCAKAFCDWSSSAALEHPSWGLRLRVRLDADRPSALGVWIDKGAYPAQTPRDQVALEPTFGRSDRLHAAVADGSALALAPREQVRWTVAYEIEELEAA